jgi:NAD(P)-dependent dehydrogenase (short-subunit alcohol dehydrogenase family)
MQELYNLTGQKILIIGDGSRIGLAVARLVSNLGAEVIISSRSTEKLEQAAATISAQVGILYTADATDALATEQMLKALAPIDHIVVTASGSAPFTGIVDTPLDIPRIAFSRFWLSYNVLHYAPSQVRPSGSITLLSDSSGRRPVVGYGGPCMGVLKL